MSGYILCQVKKAEKPFYIENISTNIYSIEELCYYLYNNLYLVDSSLISSKLCTWLEEELELPKLAAKLKPYIGREAGLEEVLYPIFKEINYLAYEELKTLNGRIEARKREPEEIREKRKGDALMENRMYVNALRVYQKLLEHGGKEITGEMRERILHNQGCAYSYLFQMDKALDCFWKAWKEKHSEKALKVYLLAYRSVHSEEEYRKRQEDLKTDEMVRQETDQALKALPVSRSSISHPEKPTGSWRISQENITEVPALKAVQEVPAGSAGLLFLYIRILPQTGNRGNHSGPVRYWSLSDRYREKYPFRKESREKRNSQTELPDGSRFQEVRKASGSCIFMSHICVKKMLEGFFSFFFRKRGLMVGIRSVKESGTGKFPDPAQCKIIAGKGSFCKRKGSLVQNRCQLGIDRIGKIDIPVIKQ